MKKFIKIVLISFIISIFLEIFVFNFRSIESYFYKEVDVSDNIVYHNINKNEDGMVTISDINDNYIEIKNINKKIKNIKLDITGKNYTDYFYYKISAQDEANKYYFDLPQRLIYPAMEKSKYVALNLSGKSKNIKISFKDNKENISFKINNISINAKVPIHFSKTRFIIFLLGLIILCVIRPKSEFNEYKVNFKSKSQIFIIILTLIGVLFSLFYVIKNVNPQLRSTYSYQNQHQYYELAEALSKGKLYLDIEPTKELKDMENPYDFHARNKSIQTVGIWDHAFYKGKYYVYFGVVPVILCYLPYYLITGSHISNYILTYIITVITVIGILLFLKEITKRYFKNIPLSLFLILFVFISFSLIGIVEYPSLYNMPIAFALMFTYWGLFFFVSAITDKQLKVWRLFAGSSCMALIAGCRPQLLLTSLLIIPIFWDTIFKQRNLFSKKSIKQTIAFVLPYIVVATLVMLYNYNRFGSIFDFGANYNLTGNDMTRRGFSIDRIGFAIFILLLQPPTVRAIFPFLMRTPYVNNFMGTTIIEPTFGGLITTNIILCLGILFFKFKKYLPKILYYFSFISVISAIIILIFDIQAAGILTRYILDFSWALYLSTIFVIMGLLNSNLNKKIKQVIFGIIIICIFINLGFQFLTIFDDQLLHQTIDYNTQFYFKWYYLLQWWL